MDLPRSGFVSEPLTALAGTFDPVAMSRGEPGLPEAFRWRGEELRVTGILDASRVYGDCRHGSGERYLRQHRYRMRIADGRVIEVSFQRTFSRSRARTRWWLHRIESDRSA